MSGHPPITVSLAALAAAATLACPGASAGAASIGLDWGGSFFLVQPQDGDSPELDLTLNLPEPGSTPAQITLYVPQGFSVYPQRPAGQPIGEADLYAFDYTAGAAGETRLQGQITAETLDAPTEAALQACSPRPHLAVWQLTLNLLGQPLEMPIAISSAGSDDPSGAQLRLDICPPALPPAGTLLPIASIELSLWELLPPRAQGAYVWRALVTPVAPDRKTPLPEQAFELRSIVPVPQTLTLRGRYAPAAHRVTLGGTLREAGKPVAGARVSIVKLVRKVFPGGVVFDDARIGSARTNAAGAYRFSARLKQTAGFIATSSPRLTPCSDTGSTAIECRGQTVAGVQSEPITISVPARHS